MGNKIIRFLEILFAAIFFIIVSYVLFPVVLTFSVFGKILTVIIALVLFAYFILRAWIRPVLRHVLAIVGICCAIIFCVLQYLDRNVITHDLNSYLKGDSEFMEAARKVLPTSVEFDDSVDVQYTHHIDGLDGEYVELRIVYDKNNFAQMLQDWYGIYPLYGEDSTPYIRTPSFTVGDMQFSFIDVYKFTNGTIDLNHYALIGYDKDEYMVILLFFTHTLSSATGPDYIVKCWYES